MYYTNGSAITKTFHGVTFRPGETKAVSGIINDPTFYKSSKRQEPPKRSRRKHSIDDATKNAKKVEQETSLEEHIDSIDSKSKDEVIVSSNTAKESDTDLAKS